MITFTYRTFVVPFSLFFTLTLGLFIPKIRASLKLRFNKKLKLTDASKNSKPIWVHCSSGEFEYAKPLLRLLKQENQKTLVTFFSHSHYEKIIESPLVDFVHPLPIDLPSPVQAFIKHFKPQKLLFSRTDVWPELALQAQLNKIPTLLFSRTQKKLNKLQKFFKKWSYKSLTAIDFVSEIDKENSLFLNQEIQFFVNGDSRYDEVIHRCEQNKVTKKISNKGFTLLLGSIWPEDIEALFDENFLSFVKKENIQLIISPHEPSSSSIEMIEDALEKKITLYSKCDSWNGQHPLVIDQFGVLFELYQYADLSFVGGSFKKQVHSVMEPLAWGCPVAIGPFNKNNREAQDFKNCNLQGLLSVVNEVNNSEELIKIIRLVKQSTINMQPRIQTLLKSKAGASNKIMQWINK